MCSSDLNQCIELPATLVLHHQPTIHWFVLPLRGSDPSPGQVGKSALVDGFVSVESQATRTALDSFGLLEE